MNNSLANKIEEILSKYRKGIIWLVSEGEEPPSHMDVLTHGQTKEAIAEDISSYTKAVIGEDDKGEYLPYTDERYERDAQNKLKEIQRQRAKELL